MIDEYLSIATRIGKPVYGCWSVQFRLGRYYAPRHWHRPWWGRSKQGDRGFGFEFLGLRLVVLDGEAV